MEKKFSHLSPSGEPQMVDVGEKKVTKRIAIAESRVVLDEAILDRLEKRRDSHEERPRISNRHHRWNYGG